MSGRSAKAARRSSAALRGKEQARRAVQERNVVWSRRRRILLLPGLVAVLVGAFAAMHFGRSGSNAPPGTNHGGSGYAYAVGSPSRGQIAPAIKLPSTSGDTFDLAAYRGKQQVLLYFQEGLTCQPCWDQIAAIQKELAKYRALGIGPIVSVTTDPIGLIKQKANDEGLTIPILSDEGARVSDAYDARTYSMTWMKPHRDGHTFILVGKDGRILWRADYGGPPKYTMFLPSDALLTDLKKALRT